ncbi:phosphodiesterase [Streptomyces sp. TRM64462]|uniref:phosphodiesterase n=1 Tax=Streptomyces sp. TRM64462 TaxID=2741726 RepID=UPI00158671D9|nr:phosphodiesterase [Streptomyces sp. TRM64462]
MTVLAHISDLHVDGGENSLRRVERTVAHLMGLRSGVDAVVVTGDVADHGTAEEYRLVREALAPLHDRYPVLLCPGNHDVRGEFRAAFHGERGDGPVDTVHDIGGVRVLMCDSSIPGRPEGLLEPETLRRLDDALADAPRTPAFVALHHPPLALGIPFVDRIALRAPQELAAVLRRHPQVAAVLCGHAHTAAATSFAGVPLRCAPAVAPTALLPWERDPDGPWSSAEAPPAIMFHLHADGEPLTTHVRTVA